MNSRNRFKPQQPVPVRVRTADFDVTVDRELPDAKAEKLDEFDTHRRAEILPDGTRRWRLR